MDNDQDRFDYEVKRLMEDPIVRAELALRDLQSSLDHVRSAMETLASYISRELWKH